MVCQHQKRSLWGFLEKKQWVLCGFGEELCWKLPRNAGARGGSWGWDKRGAPSPYDFVTLPQMPLPSTGWSRGCPLWGRGCCGAVSQLWAALGWGLCHADGFRLEFLFGYRPAEVYGVSSSRLTPLLRAAGKGSEESPSLNRIKPKPLFVLRHGAVGTHVGATWPWVCRPESHAGARWGQGSARQSRGVGYGSAAHPAVSSAPLSLSRGFNTWKWGKAACRHLVGLGGGQPGSLAV